MTEIGKMTAANATHALVCAHANRWRKQYTMPCHVLKAMPGDRVKVLVFGSRDWKGHEHVSKVRYVPAHRVLPRNTENEVGNHDRA